MSDDALRSAAEENNRAVGEQVAGLITGCELAQAKAQAIAESKR